tara:strand:+ start:660 stop:950 length:291 start_codon:yes stop_codon:yes gene_type:complete
MWLAVGAVKTMVGRVAMQSLVVVAGLWVGLLMVVGMGEVQYLVAAEVLEVQALGILIRMGQVVLGKAQVGVLHSVVVVVVQQVRMLMLMEAQEGLA